MKESQGRSHVLRSRRDSRVQPGVALSKGAKGAASCYNRKSVKAAATWEERSPFVETRQILLDLPGTSHPRNQGPRSLFVAPEHIPSLFAFLDPLRAAISNRKPYGCTDITRNLSTLQTQDGMGKNKGKDNRWSLPSAGFDLRTVVPLSFRYRICFLWPPSFQHRLNGWPRHHPSCISITRGSEA